MFCCMATVQSVAQTHFTVSNSASFYRKGELVKAKITQGDSERIDRLALYDESGKVVPYQYLPAKRGIAFLADVKPGKSLNYTLKSGKPAKAEVRTSAALMRPSTRNDIAWENSLCAYRMYSRKLLSSEPNTANGVDLWVKKKAEPVIAKMYTYASYHSEHAEGVDAYSVAGKTLGAGGNAAYVGGKLWLHDPFDHCTITANGPLYSEFTLTYDRVEVDGDYYKKTVRISISANGLLNKAVVKYEGRIKPMKIAAGIFLHTNTAGVQYKSEPNVIGYAENKSDGSVTSPNARFYEGIYMPGATATATVDNQLVIYSDYAVGAEFTYYFGGGWNVFPAGEYKADADWFAALKRFKQSEEQPLMSSDPASLPDKAQVVNAGVAANSYWIANHASPGNNLWARSVYNLGNIEFYKVYRDTQYYNYALKWAEANKWSVSGGPSTSNADNHTCGQTYYDLYRLSGKRDAGMISAIKAALDYRIANNPKSDDWWWIDAMFMAMPTFARFESEYGGGIYSEKLYALYRNTRDSLVVTSRKYLYPDEYRAKYGWGPIVKGYEERCGLYNKRDHLWWRDWGFQPGVPPKKDPNDKMRTDVPKHSPDGKCIYWSRGNGWVLAAMARTLQALPASDPHRADYEEVLRSMSAVLKHIQREDGFWNMNLADSTHFPGPETSGTALFTYAMAWGINNGILDRAAYMPVVAKAWHGLTTLALEPSGRLTRVQNVGEGPIAPSRLNADVDFGVGAFLLAASEVAKLASGEWPEVADKDGEAGSVAVGDAAFDKIIDNIAGQELHGENLPSVDAKTKLYMAHLGADGAFPDIDYGNRSQTNWLPMAHLDRMHTVILSYISPESKYYGDEKTYDAIMKMLRCWYAKNPSSTNWYYWEIGWPQRMGLNLCLMRRGKKRVAQNVETEILDRMRLLSKGPAQKGSLGTGANKMDIALQWIYRAVLQRDKATLAFAVEQFFFPLKFNSGEGLQADFSYLQHGRQLYVGGYGASVLTAIFKVAFYLQGTEYSHDENLCYINDFVKLTYVPSIRGQRMLYNVMGRSMARKGADFKARFAGGLEKMASLDPSDRDFYEKAILRLRGEKPASYGVGAYHRHYWRGDYTLHQRPGYTMDVRMASTRTARCENGNGENLKGYFITEGGTQIVQRGDEYAGIFPAWDWSRIPGTTTPAVSSVPLPKQWGQPGQSRFAGGVSDGKYGVTAYDMVDNSNGIGTRGRKAWFFFDKEVVCMGSGISSTNDAEINTTVNQCLLHGRVEALFSGSKQTKALKRGHHKLKNLSWINHDSISYFFPQGGSVLASNGGQRGRWRSISTPLAAGPEVRKDVFKLWINHGLKPEGGAYVYCIVPGTKNISEGKAAIDKMSVFNSDTLQAVGNRSLGMVGAVFYKRGTLQLDSMEVSVSQPCVLMFKNVDKRSVTVFAADPSCRLQSVNVSVRFARLASKVFNIYFDRREFYRGSTATLTIGPGCPSGRL